MKRLVLALALSALAVTGCAGAAGPQPVQGTVEALFTPWQDVEGRLLQLVARARKSIQVQAFLFTSRPLARALVEAHRRGVAVEVLADREMVAKGDNSQIPVLAAAGIPVRLEVRYASAHNKILLIDVVEDDCVVVSGSYNFTFSAQARNAENVLILRGDRRLAQAYLDNWQRHRAEALPLAEALLP
jgi:phosphatidylserine/phosphatidylglycerophosphate/cardiolipin synthase-like enzyme